MTAGFHQELRRIGEAPSSPTATLNLWVSDQTPEELLEILNRMPAPPAAADGQYRTRLLHPKISAPGDSYADSAFAPPQTNRPANGPIASSQANAPAPAADDQSVSVPYTSLLSMATSQLQRGGRIYNSVYQKETGHIFADPCGAGDRVNLDDGRVVNLREEWRKSGGDKGAESEKSGD